MRIEDVVGRGPLAFPVTPFASDGTLDVPTYREHLRWMLGFEPPALFVACGTGEFASLDEGEVGRLVEVATDEAGPGVPVFAGVGHGLGVARRMLRAVEDAGASGVLVLPPYLNDGEQRGLAAYYRSLAEATSLPMILYQRGSAVFEPETIEELASIPNVVGLKDGLGDVERMQSIVQRVGADLSYFNGMPTAETYQPAYAAMGVQHYSSAVFNFVPEVAWAFYRASIDGDQDTLNRLLGGFFVPFARLRHRVRGYAVALVKEGVAIRWGSVGPVRPPLVGVEEEHARDLARLVARGCELVGAPLEPSRAA